MSILSLYASGYPAYYSRDRSRKCPFRRKRGCDEEEIRAAMYKKIHGTYDPQDPLKAWWPRTADFYAEAIKHARKPKGVASANQFITAIRRYPKKISRAMLFAHGIKGEIQFGSGQRLGVKNITSLPNLSNHFTTTGTLDIFACNTGQSDAFLQGLADQLGVDVRGFTTGVKWRLKWDGQKPHRKITQRGVFDGLPQPNITKKPKQKQATKTGSLGFPNPSAGSRQVQPIGSEPPGASKWMARRGPMGMGLNARG